MFPMGPYILRADNLYYDIKKRCIIFAEGNIKLKMSKEESLLDKRAVLKTNSKGTDPDGSL